jgi:heme/copper-type cytochrome/quinol oxidase subunit 2
MFDFEVLRDQWIIAALGGGVILVLVAVLAYIPVWGPRTRGGHEEGTVGPEESWAEAWHYIPWLVVLTVLGTTVYAVLHAVIMGQAP